jgi:small subunit ribosomal protein S18
MKQCHFCEHQMRFVDYKNARLLRRFTDRFGRIKARYYTGTCLQHQKSLTAAIKKARIMALLPFVK